MNMFMYKNKRFLFDSLEKYFSIFCNNGNKKVIYYNYQLFVKNSVSEEREESILTAY